MTLLPSVGRAFAVLVALIIVLPLLMLAILSLSSGRFESIPWPGWSMEWYREFIHDGELQRSLLRSAVIGGMVALICSIIGFIGGYGFARRFKPLSAALLSILSAPTIIPYVLFGFCFLQLSQLIQMSKSLTNVVMAHSAVFSPVILFIVYNACRELNPEIEESARELGSSEARILFTLVLPQIWRQLLAGQIIVFALSWDEYTIAWFVSGFEKSYPVHVKTMIDSSISPEISAVGVLVAVCSCLLGLIALVLLSRSRTAGAR